MKAFHFAVCVFTVCLALPVMAAAKPNYLYNPRFTSGMAAWHGIGHIVYLKVDGTESAVPVRGARPVLKIPLWPDAWDDVGQEFRIPIPKSQLHLRVEYCASADFSPSVQPTDYTDTWKPDTTTVAKKIAFPKCDFWVRITPHYIYRTAKASRQWKTLDVVFEDVAPIDYGSINLCVPRGQGSIYVRYALLGD